MKVLQFLKTTAIGGLVFLLPFAFILFVLSYLGGRLLPLFRSVAERLDVPMIGSAVLVIIMFSVFLVGICFLAGLVAQSRLGAGLRAWIESRLLGRVPIYRMLQSVGEELEGSEASGMQSALVWTDGWQLAFVVERHPDGHVTVVLPDAPSATSGTIMYLSEDRVHLLNLKVADVLSLLRHMGLGSAGMLHGKLPSPPAGS